MVKKYGPGHRWNSQAFWRRSGSKNIRLNPGSPRPRRKNKKIFLETETGLLQPHFTTHRCMMVKQEMISGPFQGFFFYCHHVEPTVKLYVPREASFRTPLTRATSTSLDVMLEKISTITGTLMEIDNCQIRGQVSLGSRHWMKNHQMDIHDPGERDKKANDIQT